MITNNSIKEYYTKLQGMYENCYNMLQGITQSLSTKASEITVKMTNSDGTVTSVKIPSFLYLDNKLEELDTNFSALFNMPNSGEAWATYSSNMYKLNLVRSGTASVKPTLDVKSLYASMTDNNFLKDLVSPKTFLKIQIGNLPDNISQMYMKKLVLFSSDMYNSLSSMNITSYEEYKAALYNFTAGTDYEEYDSTIDLPIRKDTYKSSFSILELPTDESTASTNPWVDESETNYRSKLSYKLRLDTLQYSDQEDSSVVFTLKVGDYLCLSDKSVVYQVKNVDTSEMTVIVEEYVGHIALQTVEENSDMILQIYNKDYSSYHYVEVPLEENEWIVVFLGTIMNNVRSELSDGFIINLNNIYMKDSYGNYIDDSYGNHLSYIEYYKKYCTNIGDLILGITETAYPQISNFSSSILEKLQDGSDVQKYVSDTFDVETILEVVPINKHLVDDVTSDDIINLHTQKNDLNQQLTSIQDNISQLYNTLISTDFSKETSITQTQIQSQLKSYYTERTSIQTQLNNIVDNINTKSTNLNITGEDVKYRVRGITEVDNLETYISSIAGDNVHVIGLDVEYKYKSPLKKSNNVTIIDNNTFTDWTRLNNIDRQRKISFTSSNAMLDFVDYKTTDNIIKWNQIDIPIQQGEDVIIRIRYKLNIGQPFFNMYTAWSDEKTMIFPSQYEEDVNLTTILSQNENDTITSSFSKTLINEGYSEHIQNKLVSSDQTFFHLPENIYSGFNTSENNLISLKDKLLEFNSSIEEYKTALDNETNSKFEVYLNYDDTSMLLTSNSKNVINIYNNEHISSQFIKKNMNITIKNTGDVRLNLYSIFPGQTDNFLLNTDMEFYNDRIANYERVPLFVNNSLTGQTLGQWIYFRETNPFTKEDLYFQTSTQNNLDYENVSTKSPLQYIEYPSEYIGQDNKQVLLGYRNRTYKILQSTTNSNESFVKWKTLLPKDSITKTIDSKDYKFYPLQFIDVDNSSVNSQTLSTVYNNMQAANNTWFLYDTSSNNNYYLMRYEDISITNTVKNTNVLVYLDEKTDISTFLSSSSVLSGFSSGDGSTTIDNMVGAFLYVDVDSRELLLTKGGEKDSVYVEVGGSLTIPVKFEYFITATSNKTSVKKSLLFDLRNSLVRDPIHYYIEVVGNYDYTASGNIYNSNEDSGLSDNATSSNND